MIARTLPAILLVLVLAAPASAGRDGPRTPIPDTGQTICLGDRDPIDAPAPGEPYFGQDAQYAGNGPSYRDDGDGTVADLVTGLTWQKTPDFVVRTLDDALAYAKSLRLGGHDDWRLPNIRELFSIADFRGNTHARRPYLDTMNAHGAGAVRSDPKSGDPADYANGHGPQGDEIRIRNYAFAVRGGKADLVKDVPSAAQADAGPTGPGPGGPGGGEGRGGRDFVSRLDRDGDGKVSREEFDGPPERFRDFDRDGDGFISADEAPTGPPPRRGPPDGGRRR